MSPLWPFHTGYPYCTLEQHRIRWDPAPLCSSFICTKRGLSKCVVSDIRMNNRASSRGMLGEGTLAITQPTFPSNAQMPLQTPSRCCPRQLTGPPCAHHGEGQWLQSFPGEFNVCGQFSRVLSQPTTQAIPPSLQPGEPPPAES